MNDDTLEDDDLEPATQAYFAPLTLWGRLRFVGYEPAPEGIEAELSNTWGLLRQLSGLLSDLVDDSPTQPAPPALREADRAVHAAAAALSRAVVEAQQAGS